MWNRVNRHLQQKFRIKETFSAGHEDGILWFTNLCGSFRLEYYINYFLFLNTLLGSMLIPKFHNK